MSAPVAFVTGASRGIGKQLCQHLAVAGYDVVCAARSSEDRPGKLVGTVDATAALVEAAGRQALPLPLDVRDETAVHDAVEQVMGELGRIDLLVNNAAVAPAGAALDQSVRRWDLVMEVNLDGPFYLCWHAGNHMRAAGAGRIVNISSTAAHRWDYGRAAYTVSKAALETLTRCLAVELAPAVAVNCLQVEVGVATAGHAAVLDDDDEAPLEDPAVVAEAVVRLARAPLSFTGEVMTLADVRAAQA
jgi:NAD(P)-dependent dehydrogenase (short-subunit alcohol dehydrogenase family)